MSSKKSDEDSGIGGVLKNLGDLVEKLGQLAETGEKLKRSGTFETTTEKGEKVKGDYGVSVRFGLGGEGETQVSPVSKSDKKDEQELNVKEISTPPVDIFPAENSVQVIAQVPGIDIGDVELQLFGDVLTIIGKNKTKHYYKEIVLPFVCQAQAITSQCNNGILEINLLRDEQSHE